MTRHVQTRTAPIYRDQLARVRRFLGRVEVQNRSDIEYQDDMWAFFQNCWHLKDWVRNDDLVPEQTRNQVRDLVHASPLLMVCHDMANGTKHLKLTTPRAGTGAAHDLTDTTVIPGVATVVDTRIDMGDGTLQSGLEVARKCVVEWERILQLVGLPI